MKSGGSRNSPATGRRRRSADKDQAAGRRRLISGVNVLLLVLIAGAGAYWLRDRTPPAPTSPPEPTYSTTADGVRVARIDVARLKAWCRSNGLPDPPSLHECEPAVAESLTEALSLAATKPGAATWARLGMICEALDCHNSAEVCFLRAMKADPRDFRWPYYLGCIYQATGRENEAIQRFLTVLELNPDYPLTHGRLGHLYLEAGEVQTAQRHLERYVALRPRDSLGYVGLGRVALRRNDHQTALRHLLQGLQRMPSDFQCHYYLGRTYAALGREDLARKHFETCSKLPRGSWFAVRDPLDRELNRSTGSVTRLVEEFELLQSSGDWPRMANLAEEIIQRRTRDTTMLLNLASIYRKMKRYDDAHRAIDRAMEAAPELARVHATRAAVLLAEGKLKESLTAAGETLRRDPQDAGAYNVRGRVLFMQKQLAEAEQAMRRCLELKPDQAGNVLVLAEILRASGRFDEAARSYNRVLELAPGQPTATQRLAELERQE